MSILGSITSVDGEPINVIARNCRVAHSKSLVYGLSRIQSPMSHCYTLMYEGVAVAKDVCGDVKVWAKDETGKRIMWGSVSSDFKHAIEYLEFKPEWWRGGELVTPKYGLAQEFDMRVLTVLNNCLQFAPSASAEDIGHRMLTLRVLEKVLPASLRMGGCAVASIATEMFSDTITKGNIHDAAKSRNVTAFWKTDFSSWLALYDLRLRGPSTETSLDSHAIASLMYWTDARRGLTLARFGYILKEAIESYDEDTKPIYARLMAKAMDSLELSTKTNRQSDREDYELAVDLPYRQLMGVKHGRKDSVLLAFDYDIDVRVAPVKDGVWVNFPTAGLVYFLTLADAHALVSVGLSTAAWWIVNTSIYKWPGSSEYLEELMVWSSILCMPAALDEALMFASTDTTPVKVQTTAAMDKAWEIYKLMIQLMANHVPAAIVYNTARAAISLASDASYVSDTEKMKARASLDDIPPAYAQDLRRLVDLVGDSVTDIVVRTAFQHLLLALPHTTADMSVSIGMPINIEEFGTVAGKLDVSVRDACLPNAEYEHNHRLCRARLMVMYAACSDADSWNQAMRGESLDYIRFFPEDLDEMVIIVLMAMLYSDGKPYAVRSVGNNWRIDVYKLEGELIEMKIRDYHDRLPLASGLLIQALDNVPNMHPYLKSAVRELGNNTVESSWL